MMSESYVQPKASFKKLEIDWRKVGQLMLKQSLPINPFTTLPEEAETEWEDLNLTLGLVDRNKKESQSQKQKLDIIQRYTQEEFFKQVLQQQKSKSKGRRLAIIGLSGTGKTILLHHIASWILKNTEDIPIWISLSDVSQLTLREYLQEKWLPRAMKTQPHILFDWNDRFNELLNSHRVWLLLDGVDEMAIEQVLQQHLFYETSTILSPLSIITQQLQGWADKTKVILNSRNYSWETDPNLLSNFDIYHPLSLSSIDEIKQFVKKCFTHLYLSNKIFSWQDKNLIEEQKRQNLPNQLCQALEQFGQERISDLMNTPLRIALLCRLWHQKNPNFPQTKSNLYQELVTEFYQWQAEKVTTTIEVQSQLNQFLGKLALKVRQKEPDSSSLKDHLIIEESEQAHPLFQLAIKLGWLKLSGIFSGQSNQKIYGFLDTSFQDYFAALVIQDWAFFFGDDLKANKPSSEYPIFNKNWKNTILFWLGREDISKEDKEAFLKELINFQDKCSSENYYGKRAYFLAATGLAEFTMSEQSEKILGRLIQWAFDSYNYPQPVMQEARKALILSRHPKAIAILVELLTCTNNPEISEEIFQCLEKLGKGQPSAITALNQLIEMPSTYLQWQGAETLGKIDPGNLKAIDILTRLIEISPHEELRQSAFNSLEKIGQGNAKIITTVIRQIQSSESPVTQRRAFECLEKIGQGNATAIASLVQLIRTTKNLSIRRQAAESLEKIDPGNPTALAVLIQLLQDHFTEEIRQQAVYSLGEISSGNRQAIEALIHLLSSNQTMLTQWLAVSSLGKIGVGSQAVINTLVRLVQSSTHLLLRKDAIESLSKIAPHHPVAISTLVELMEKSEEEATRREVAESLGRIDPGNPEAIKTLVQILHSSEDEFTKRQAAVSLSKIDSGNLEALCLLVQQAQSTQDKDIRSLAAESLGEIGQSNSAAIATLIRLIKPQQDPNTLKKAASSLGKIAQGNKEAIAALIKVLQFSEDASTRLQASESLINILFNSQLTDVIPHLQPLLYDPKYYMDVATQKLIWHCVKHITYPDFYEAWHQTNVSIASKIPLDIVITPPALPKSFSQQLNHLIQEHPFLSDKIRLICIDSNELIDAKHPLVDIYDQMLQQKCPPFEHGIPETMAKLRLYWNMLCRSQKDYYYVWVFYDSETDGFTENLWQSLNKFKGLICGVTEYPLAKIQQFSPTDPEVCLKIIQWLEHSLLET
ncbi:PBS lyase [Aphanothece hegewaldii CCALA 016]|uniref:PBS lyase n=1 Tax=Aphanothece hegewaldii CCALA 016 TaxID=2107694 RepID=A0A2T1LZV8_9CHRO|nr:HEAT repeat domain-containing protein [Aphanothece hegewaldii]PSF37933.1 PBS lyase [Aphanothece hegewaldii CCALA 016]